ncbi:hypothetical protein BASA81_005174 [Batrachochytrium salamandrivorans]|nr:hypothetical protein BASA81_005174 [Batrachochytrium salamandrivorans]
MVKCVCDRPGCLWNFASESDSGRWKGMHAFAAYKYSLPQGRYFNNCTAGLNQRVLVSELQTVVIIMLAFAGRSTPQTNGHAKLSPSRTVLADVCSLFSAASKEQVQNTFVRRTCRWILWQSFGRQGAAGQTL